MTKYVEKAGIQVSSPLYDLVENRILPELPMIQSVDIWAELSSLLKELAPENKSLLLERDDIQAKLDTWHQSKIQDGFTLEEYKTFLREIDYLVPEGDDFEITTKNVDPEIATVAGPQLVVPINNARYSLNASNARWGSLYDALYGTDAISDEGNLAKGSGFNDERGKAVITKGLSFLDEATPLESGSYSDAVSFQTDSVDSEGNAQLEVTLADGSNTKLKDSNQFIAQSQEDSVKSVLLKNNGLHLELQIDNNDRVGSLHPSGIKDIILESALTVIQDCEDSVAAVDAEDKAGVYSNWLGLMRGDLTQSVEKSGRTIVRKLNADRNYTAVNGEDYQLSGRSLMLIRHVGHLMTTNTVLLENGDEAPEGIIDAFVNTLIALYDIHGVGPWNNSKTKSIYVVKPKMHGPKEVAFSEKLFSSVEDIFNLPRNTLKIGIMDEERRTTVNLKECIRAVKDRIIFINTGFLDRTGDEIHTSMAAGPFLPKNAIKGQPWLNAYENSNVDIGLMCGLQGKAQIGKGMWAMPDLMHDMLEQKSAHLKMGANCAWVPSPTAATLHATHYHQVNVKDVQDSLKQRERANVDDILTIPLMQEMNLDAEEIQRELDNNAQGILGYVVRWINDGIGCSKVPDVHDVGLMEDRATLRISSQHLANWLQHGICTEEQVRETFKKMALVVDEQNSSDPTYTSMAPSYDGIAFKASLDLALEGHKQPNGYTEPLLHKYRRVLKQSLAQ